MSKGRILICEDNEAIVQLTSFALQAEGYETDTAETTDQVLEKLNSSFPDLVLLDLNLPEKGGAFIIEHLRSKDETSHIPVLLFSAEEKLAEITKELHADGYVKKPFDVNELMLSIENAMVHQ